MIEKSKDVIFQVAVVAANINHAQVPHFPGFQLLNRTMIYTTTIAHLNGTTKE
jgi:hypothetical protein